MEGIPREDGFNISVASEIMAIICLSKTISELKSRLDNITIGKNFNKEPVLLKELKVSGAVAALLKDTIRPNLVQTLEKTPAFIHGGPFANIAHGCNSINATECALALGDYVVTEAGFAADLGAEKFLDIKSRIAGLHPDAVVVVATIRALKMHGGVQKSELNQSNVEALKKGFENLKTHIENLGKFKVPVVIAINQFASDTEEEIKALEAECKAINTSVVLCQGHAKGGEGAKELAEKVCAVCDSGISQYQQLYPLEMPLEEKIRTVAKEIYRAKDVSFSDVAKKKLAEFTAMGFGNLPICVAKTQYSFSHDKNLICAPKDFIFPIQDVRLYSGAGFVVPLAGDIMTMPGLPKVPAACSIDVDDDGVITGLF
jgi:formate--tetrahydrofolate ligase